MFPAVSSSSVDLTLYDFTAKENESKWKSIFISGIRLLHLSVSQKRGHSVQAREDAFDYMEKLLLQLLGMICSRPFPHSVQDVQERILKMFPPPIDQWVTDEATSAIKQGRKKADLVFPIDKIHSLLQKEVFQYQFSNNVAVYIAAVLEYIAADILQMVGNYVKHSRHGDISTQDIKAAMCCDKVLCDLFKLGDWLFAFTVVEDPITRNSLSYNEVVDDLLQTEKHYLRDLQMLIKVFREELANKLEIENQSLELVFTSIVDITELTITLISTVEDTLEMTEPNQIPAIGICFLELAENWDFDVYDRYAEAFNENCRQGLTDLLSRPNAELTVSTAGHGFVEAVKFYFPKLLLEPFYHCMQYFEYIKMLYRLSLSEKDKTDLLQADSVLTPLKSLIGKLLPNIPKKTTGDLGSRISGKGNKQIAQQKFTEIKNQVEGLGDSLGQTYFNEFFCEGELQKIGSGKKPSERHAYLFDGFMFLCKPNHRRTSVVTGGPQHEYRLKESFCMTKVEVRAREDSDEWKHLFEIVIRDQSPVLLSCRTYEEKSNWMSILVMLTTKSMLDRILDRILSDEEKKHPLRLPPLEKYRFAVADADSNIIFDKDNGNQFLIKGATLLKLVERLTHHQYSDPNFINTFLTTYRSFCSPNEFLDLLIERYNIPDPDFDAEDIESIHERKMLKRFRKEYARHIKLRVLNVIKQWVIHHFYDFERDPNLQVRLECFLDTAEGSNANSILESVRRCLKKAVENSNNIDLDRSFAAMRSPPPLEYHIKRGGPSSEWNLLNVHPIELARQLTLLEFDLYRVVKPSELVGSVWTKKHKEQSSPNLLKMIKHTTNVTRWFERMIVDSANFEERVAVVSRILEVMMVLQELNNFNGVLAVVSAMGSASVHRLNFTFQSVPQRFNKALEEAQDLQNEHYKKYQERLRSVNPPCVPFFGMYLTNILHIEEGNLDFLPNSADLINFSKRRKVAEITAEIRQFQYSHYCLSVEHSLREFIENLQPFDLDTTENDISNYLYAKSLEIEPRGAKQPPRFPKKWPDINLKSPGIKPKNLPGKSHPGPLGPFSSSSTMSLSSTSSRMGLDSDLDPIMDSSFSQTPKNLTPSSVQSATSPLHKEDHDHSIFVPVIIGAIAQNSAPAPPPLPPRRKNNSVGESSSSPKVRDAPGLPPPLPPRRLATPIPPVPRRNSATTSMDTPTMSPSNSSSAHLPLLSPERLTKSPNRSPGSGHSLLSNSSTNGCTNCGTEHCHQAFVFDHDLTVTPPSPLRIPHRVPLHSQTPPQLPPKSRRREDEKI